MIEGSVSNNKNERKNISFVLIKINRNEKYFQHIANIFINGTKAWRIRLRTVPQHCFDITDAVRAVGVPGSLWKCQQSRDHTFLHWNYTQLVFSTPKKIFLWDLVFFFGNFSNSEKIKIFIENSTDFHWIFNENLLFSRPINELKKSKK